MAEQAFVEVHLILTRSGSLYRVARDAAGTWWLSGHNVASAVSRYIGHGVWRIRRPFPWPPDVGRPLLLLAPAGLSRDDPDRLPGGGKITSTVTAVWSGDPA